MKIIIVVLATFVFSLGYGQIGITGIGQKDSCYLKYDKNHNVIRNTRYAEWQCGKLAGVIDCNGKLELDPESGIVYMNNQDLVNSQNANKPFTGRCETCHMNGSIERRVSFVNGKQNGIDTTYYESGCPQVIRNHIQGVEQGQWLYYYDSTNYLAWEMNFIAGQKHGKQIYFASDGDTTLWENYYNGVLQGTKRSYFDDSKIKREANYMGGLLEGKFKLYNAKGIVIEELNYKQGKKDDECKYFYNDGVPLKTEHWDYGVKNGEFKMFFYNGSVQVSENYKKGSKEGWFMEYYQDGTTKRKAFYKKNELTEEHRYDEQGRETYSFGAPTGDQMEDDEMPSTSNKKKKD